MVPHLLKEWIQPRVADSLRSKLVKLSKALQQEMSTGYPTVTGSMPGSIVDFKEDSMNIFEMGSIFME